MEFFKIMSVVDGGLVVFVFVWKVIKKKFLEIVVVNLLIKVMKVFCLIGLKIY